METERIALSQRERDRLPKRTARQSVRLIPFFHRRVSMSHGMMLRSWQEVTGAQLEELREERKLA